MVISSRALGIIWLVLALLVGQQGAVLHALTHYASEPATDQSSQDKQHPGHLVCAKCLAYSNIDSPLPGTSPALAQVADSLPVIAAPVPQPRLSSPRFYAQRAPPLPV